MTRCAIWYHLHNLKNMKNTHRGVLILQPASLLKLTLFHGCFSSFPNCTNSTKSRNASQLKHQSEVMARITYTILVDFFITFMSSLILCLLAKTFSIFSKSYLLTEFYCSTWEIACMWNHETIIQTRIKKCKKNPL